MKNNNVIAFLNSLNTASTYFYPVVLTEATIRYYVYM